jgi:hypothetical protein
MGRDGMGGGLMDDTNGMITMDLMITCALGFGGSKYVCGLFTSRVTRS